MKSHVERTIHNPAEVTRAFPTPGTNLERVLNDPAFRRAFHARLKTYNPLIVALYRAGLLPLFGAARTVMLLTTLGRRSRKPRRTPIGYFRIGGVVHVFSAWGRRSNWYKNLSANPQQVSIQIGMRQQPVRAEVLEDPVEIRRTLEQFIQEQPDQARILFGWEPGSDRIESADFSVFDRDMLIVRFIPISS